MKYSLVLSDKRTKPTCHSASTTRVAISPHRPLDARRRLEDGRLHRGVLRRAHDRRLLGGVGALSGSLGEVRLNAKSAMQMRSRDASARGSPSA
ncbi:hypothetical protein Ct61P_15097 [Colletotrichum tofieldiae]|nr:hypothetical protein Ct61P_15097 [Colletotrichum tofieldiae]